MKCVSLVQGQHVHTVGVQIEYDIQINEFQMSMPFYITLKGDCEESMPHVSNCSSHCHMSQTVQAFAKMSCIQNTLRLCLTISKLLRLTTKEKAKP